MKKKMALPLIVLFSFLLNAQLVMSSEKSNPGGTQGESKVEHFVKNVP